MTSLEERKEGWVGRAISRVGDGPLLRGRRSLTDDRTPPGTLHVAFVRAAQASARLRGIDAEAARELAGVAEALTPADVGLAGLIARLSRPGFVEMDMPLLAAERIRHVGEPVAMVLADAPCAAEVRAEAVVPPVEAAEAVASVHKALADDAPDNVLFAAPLVDDEGMDDLLADATHAVEVEVSATRLSAVPLEGWAVLAEWNGDTGRLHVTTSTQMPHLVRTSIAARIAHHAAHRLPEGRGGRSRRSRGPRPAGHVLQRRALRRGGGRPRCRRVVLRRYVVAEDCGVMLNPLVVEGQVRGGIAPGIAAALCEKLPYGADGQPLPSTLLDYVVPTAAEVPDVEVLHLETSRAHAVTGAKGMGEGGTIGAPAPVLNAINDAIGQVGARLDAIPVSPARLRAAVAGRQGGAT